MDTPQKAFSTQSIHIDDFSKIDMRIGTVIACEAVPKSQKLLKLVVDDGERERIILSGLAAYYTPASLVGEQVVFVANLPARKMMNAVSEGMILTAEKDGTIRLIQPDEGIDNGAKIG